MIAKISGKYHWEITGKSKISDAAREIVKGESPFAKYVHDESTIDTGKLDIWWASFFATGEKKYLRNILSCAEPPKLDSSDVNLVTGTAAWSVKANCKQHKAVAAFVKECLDKNAFPEKTDFLKECLTYAKEGAH
jgi:hypothetical protein